MLTYNGGWGRNDGERIVQNGCGVCVCVQGVFREKGRQENRGGWCTFTDQVFCNSNSSSNNHNYNTKQQQQQQQRTPLSVSILVKAGHILDARMESSSTSTDAFASADTPPANVAATFAATLATGVSISRPRSL